MMKNSNILDNNTAGVNVQYRLVNTLDDIALMRTEAFVRGRLAAVIGELRNHAAKNRRSGNVAEAVAHNLETLATTCVDFHPVPDERVIGSFGVTPSWRYDNGFDSVESVCDYITKHPGTVIQDARGVDISVPEFREVVERAYAVALF